MPSPPPNRSDELPSSTRTDFGEDFAGSKSNPDMFQCTPNSDDSVDAVCSDILPQTQDAVARHAAPPHQYAHSSSQPTEGDAITDGEAKMSHVVAHRGPHVGGSEDLMHCGRLSFSSDTLSEPGCELLLNKSFVDEPVLQGERYSSSLLRKLGHRQTLSRFAPFFAEPLGNADSSHVDRRASRTDSIPSLTHTDPGNSPLSSRTPTLNEPREMATPPEILPEGGTDPTTDYWQHRLARAFVLESDGYKLYSEDSVREYVQRLCPPSNQAHLELGPTSVPHVLPKQHEERDPCETDDEHTDVISEIYEVSDESEWDLSESNDEMDESHPCYEAKEVLIRNILSEYSKWKQRPVCGGRNSNSNTASTSQSGSTGMTTPLSGSGISSLQAPKRPLPNNNDGQDDDDDDDERAFKRPSFGSSATGYRLKFLACPFAKKDPLRYGDCYRIRIRRIQDVKQHLRRQHTPVYCRRCLKVFPAEQQLEAHQRNPTACEVKEDPKPEGIISQEQKDRLKARINPKLPIKEQWFSIFSILFPGERRPSSPFLDGELGEEVSRFASWMEVQGTDVIVGQLKELGLHTKDAMEEDRLTEILNSTVAGGMRAIVEKWKEQTVAPDVPSLTEDDTPGAPSLTEGDVTGAPSIIEGEILPLAVPPLAKEGARIPGEEQASALLTGVSQALQANNEQDRTHRASNMKPSMGGPGWLPLGTNMEPAAVAPAEIAATAGSAHASAPEMQGPLQMHMPYSESMSEFWGHSESDFEQYYRQA